MKETTMLLKNVIFPIIALFFMAMPASAQDGPTTAQPGVSGLPDLTLGAWAGLAEDDRQTLVLAAIEGFFLATVNNPQVGNAVNEKCLASLTPGKIDRRLLKMAAQKPFARFSDAFFDVATCEKKEK